MVTLTYATYSSSDTAKVAFKQLGRLLITSISLDKEHVRCSWLKTKSAPKPVLNTFQMGFAVSFPQSLFPKHQPGIGLFNNLMVSY